MADPTTGREPASGLTAAWARLDELARRQRPSLRRHPRRDEFQRPRMHDDPPTPAELVEVLRGAGLTRAEWYEPGRVIRLEAGMVAHPRWAHIPAHCDPTLRAVGAVLTLMEENGR